MSKDNKHNLSKLRQLCEELTDRDEQLKLNASALWDILEIVSGVRDDLSAIEANNPDDQNSIKECISELKRVDCIISTKGCKKVAHGH